MKTINKVGKKTAKPRSGVKISTDVLELVRTDLRKQPNGVTQRDFLDRLILAGREQV